MKLSDHFTLEEMVRSATASRNNIPNTPSQAEIQWLQYLCVNVLEPLRNHMGRPISVSSGYRCPKLNTLVGGVAKSQHQYGQAADIRILNKQDGDKIFAYLKTNKYVSKALYERSKSTGARWIHVAVAAVPVRYFNSDFPAN